jgi:hypothetical protein
MKHLMFCLLFALLFDAALAATTGVEATITYVSVAGVYLDAGRAQGLAVGDTGVVRHGTEQIARIEILFVADHSASARTIEATGEIQTGDKALVEFTARPSADTVAVAPLPPSIRESTSAPAKVKPTGSRVVGRIAVQYLAQASRTPLNYDYTQPSLVLRLTAENLFNSHYALNVRLRSRRTYQSHQFTSGRSHDWYNRVYEVALSYDDPAASVSFAAGRLLSNRLAGIGYLDGARFDYRAAPHVTVGAFGGTQPNPATSDVSSAVTETGAYAVYERGNYNTQRLAATLALAGEYHHGNISREFFYQQLDWSRGSTLSLYQSANFGIHRGWQQRVSHSALDLSDLLVNARYAPARLIALNAGYDERTPFRTWETRTLADSLFDASSQQGYRAGLDLHLPWAMRADVRGTLRTSEHDSQRARTVSLGVGTSNLLGHHIALDGRVNRYRNRFTTGNQGMLSLSRYLTAWWNAGAQIGRDTYDLRQQSQRFTSRWLRLTSDWTVTRHIYSSAYAEFYRGEPFAGTRAFMELGWRL